MAHSRGRILVIDEHPEDATTLQDVLSQKHFEVLCFTSSDDGIRAAESKDPDLIILDIHLQGGKGLDVCRNLRLRNSTWSIPIILIADGTADEAAIVRGLDMGANDCVTRPFRHTELMSRVGVLMRMKRVEDKLRRLYVERTRELEWSNMELQKIRTQLILKSQMSTLGLLVAVAAHEIRSPAASIAGNLEQTGPLLHDLLESLLQLLPALVQSGGEALELFFALMQEVVVINLKEPPLEVPARRRAARALEPRLRAALTEEPDEDLADNLARYRLDDQLVRIVPLLNTHGEGSLKPLYCLAELLIKVRNMGVSIERINNIIRAMKAWPHVDRQELQELDIHSGLDDTLLIMGYIFRGSVEVVKHYADELPRTLGHPGELNQVWTNLLQNAYDALDSSERRIALHTGVETRDGNRFIVVRVVDSGRGIPPEIVPHIFDTFFSTKEKGKGSGLGLDICKQIIEKHGGEIVVETVPGRTCFSVYLPLAGQKKPARPHPVRSLES